MLSIKASGSTRLQGQPLHTKNENGVVCCSVRLSVQNHIFSLRLPTWLLYVFFLWWSYCFSDCFSNGFRNGFRVSTSSLLSGVLIFFSSFFWSFILLAACPACASGPSIDWPIVAHAVANGPAAPCPPLSLDAFAAAKKAERRIWGRIRGGRRVFSCGQGQHEKDGPGSHREREQEVPRVSQRWVGNDQVSACLFACLSAYSLRRR